MIKFLPFSSICVDPVTEEEPDASDAVADNQPVQGSFLNLLPPRLEVSQDQKGPS